MKAILLNIGDELLSGRISDLNGPWLARWFFKQGIEFKKMALVPDSSEELKLAILEAWNDPTYDLIILSGGLGPTKDDITKSIIASAFNLKLNNSDQATALTRKHYSRIGKEWDPSINSYNIIPDEIIAVENLSGLAPGLVYVKQDKVLLAAPGVPREFSKMIETQLFSFISKKLKMTLKNKNQITIRTFGIPEEKLFSSLIPDLWKNLEKWGQVSSYPQTIGIDIVISFDATNEQKKIIEDEIKNYVSKSKLLPYIWQWGTLSLPELIVKKAKEKNIKIAFAESCTGGLTSSKITDVSGSSEIYMGSAITYSNESKVSLLGVQVETINKHGAVSLEVAKEMAEGALDQFDCDLTISYTGIAGPTGGSVEKPVGTVAIGIANKNKAHSKIFEMKGERLKLKNRFSEQGLLLLLSEIESY